MDAAISALLSGSRALRTKVFGPDRKDLVCAQGKVRKQLVAAVGEHETAALLDLVARPGRLQTESSALARGDTVSDQATPDLQLHQSIIASQIEINIAHCDVIWIH